MFPPVLKLEIEKKNRGDNKPITFVLNVLETPIDMPKPITLQKYWKTGKINKSTFSCEIFVILVSSGLENHSRHVLADC